MSLENALLVCRTRVIRCVKLRSILYHLQGSDFYKDYLKKMTGQRNSESHPSGAKKSRNLCMLSAAFGRGSSSPEDPRMLEASLSKALSTLKRLIEEALVLMTVSAKLQVIPRRFLWRVLTQCSCSRITGKGDKSLVRSGN